MIKKRCPKCNTIYSIFVNFCGKDGEKLLSFIEKEKKYSEKTIDNGIFRVVMTIEKEFASMDEAEDAARHSCFDEDGEFNTVDIVPIKPTATKEDYPWICNSCYEAVTHDPEEYCEFCDIKDWVKRKNGED